MEDGTPLGRQSERVPIQRSGTLSWATPGQRAYAEPAVAIDCSEAGYRFRVEQSPEVGQRVHVDLPPARRSWGTVRHVTWADGVYDVGVEMDPEPPDGFEVEE